MSAGYQTYGEDFETIATDLPNRSPRMVGSLFSLHRELLQSGKANADIFVLIAADSYKNMRDLLSPGSEPS